MNKTLSIGLLVMLAVATASCGTKLEGTDSTTQFWMQCNTDDGCAGLSCICGHCTEPCSEAAACSEFGATTLCETLDNECNSQQPICMPKANTGIPTASLSPSGSVKPSDTSNPGATAKPGDSSEPGDTGTSEDSGNETDGSANSTDASATSDAAGSEPTASSTPELPDGSPQVNPPREIKVIATEGTWIRDFSVATALYGAAILYAEADDPSGGTAPVRIKVQLLNIDGSTLSAAQELDQVLDGDDDVDRVSIASYGANYFACWEGSDEVRCVSLDWETGATERVLTRTGRAPTIASGGGNWVVAYAQNASVDSPHGDTLLTALSPEFEPIGTDATFGPLGLSEAPMVAGNTTGIALLDRVAGGPQLSLRRLDLNFATVGEPLELSADWLGFGDIAMSEASTVLFSLSTPYAAKVVKVDNAGADYRVIPGGTKTGQPVDVYFEGEGPVANWADLNNTVHVSVFDDLAESTSGTDVEKVPEIGIVLIQRRRVAVLGMVSVGNYNTGLQIVSYD